MKHDGAQKNKRLQRPSGHSKMDGPRRTPKHIGDPAAYRDMYLVEDIIAERNAKKRKEWLVRWKGRGARRRSIICYIATTASPYTVSQNLFLRHHSVYKR